jgi:hypothetical protein
MKKSLVLLLLFCFAIFSAKTYGQETKEKERKGGFAVGGYDNTRQQQDKVVTKRSVELPAEEEQAEKAAEPEKVPAANEAKPQEGDKGNAYGKDKDGLEGKEFGQTRSQQAKAKTKVKKVKSKGDRR